MKKQVYTGPPRSQALGHLVFEGLLPLHADVYQQYKERYSSADSQAALVRFVASKRHGLSWQGVDWVSWCFGGFCYTSIGICSQMGALKNRGPLGIQGFIGFGAR